MSGWGLGWFGGGGGAKKKDAPKNAILQLRGTLDMLTKREKHLQNQMDEQDTIARKFVASNKSGTYGLRSSLKRKRRAIYSSRRGISSKLGMRGICSLGCSRFIRGYKDSIL